MTEERLKGIVISAKDFKEADKLLTLFTLEKGIVYAKLVGVKKPNAKLKPAKEIFCFADFDVVSKGEFQTITSANVIETFHNITSDIDKYFAGCAVLEILKTVGRENLSNEPLFLETLKTLQALAYGNVKPEVLEMRFLIKIFEAMGYRLSLDRCASCGEPFLQKRFFSPVDGAIVCSGCKPPNCEEISALAHSTMRLAADCPFEKLETLKLSDEGTALALKLLKENFEARFDKKLSN